MADAYTGEVRAFGFNYPPLDWAFCLGSEIAVQQNQALYSIIGNIYGGTQNVNFKIPDLQGRTPLGVGSGPGLTPYEPGQQAGSETVTLIQSEMPSHTHGIVGGAPATAPNEIAKPDATSYLARIWNTSTNPATPIAVPVQTNPPNTVFADQMLTVAGGYQPHENRQPLLVMNFCICTYGYYPVPDDN